MLPADILKLADKLSALLWSWLEPRCGSSLKSLHRVHQRREALNPHFQTVAASDQANATGQAGQDHVAGRQQIVNGIVADLFDFQYISRVNRLTKQEQMVLCIVLGLLLTGWAVKTYRTAHPAPAATQPAKP